MADNQEDGDADIRWLSYAQIAKIRGISRASAERIVRRAKWRRQVDNQGVTRAAVPLAYAEPERINPPDSQAEIPPGANSLQAAIDALREQQDHERTAWREERGRLVADLDRERARADTLRDRLNTMQEQLADAHAALQAAEEARVGQAEQARDEERARAGKAEAAAAAERARADALRERIEALQEQLAAHQEGVDATEAIRQAEAMVDNLREAHAGEVSALKTERHRLATQIDGFAARADQAEARTDSLRARVDVLQRERDTAREAAEVLRQADVARRHGGRLARILRALRRG